MSDKEITLDKRENTKDENNENNNNEKQKVFEMKIYYLYSESQIEKKTLEIKEIFIKKLGEVPYMRFNKKEGHLILNIKSELFKIDLINEIKENGIEIDEESKILVRDIKDDEKSGFWKYHGNHFETIFKRNYKNSLQLKYDGDSINKKNGFFLGFQRFKNINQLKLFFSNMLKKYEVNKIVEENDKVYLKELIKYHSNKDKFIDIKDFKVDYHPEFDKTKCFFIIDNEEKITDFSFNKCIKNLSNK